MLARARNSLARLLRRTEQYTKTDMIYLASGGSWLGAGQLVASVSAFFLAVAFANLVPKDTYGMYKYVLSLVGVLGIVTLPGINTYMAQAIARGAEGTFLYGTKFRIKWGLVGAVMGLGIAGYYAINSNLLLAASFVIASLFLPFMDPLGNYNVYLQSKKMFREAIQYYSVAQILATTVLILAIFIAPHVLFLLFIYFAVYTGLRLFFLLRTLRLHPANDVTDKNLIRYGTHLSIVNVLGLVALQIDSVVLFHSLGAVAVAVYAFALAPSEQIRSLFKNIVPLSLPRLAQRKIHEINVLLPQRMLQLALLGAASATIYWIISPYFFSLFFPKYLEAIAFSQTLAWLLVLTLPSMFLATAVQAKLHSMPPAWLYWAAAPDAIHVVGLIVLTPIFGIYGVIMSKALDIAISLFISVIQWILLSRGIASGRFSELETHSR